MLPEIKYAQSGDVNIAYQVIGDGPLDLVYIPGTVSHLDLWWEYPRSARFFQRLASFSRLILFDKRGTGLSDRVEIATLEQRMDDVRAVMDAAGSTSAAVLGLSEGGAMAMLFAATYPERTTGLILIGAYAKEPDTMTEAELNALAREIRETANTPERTRRRLGYFAPSLADDEPTYQFFSKLFRLGASPGALVALARMNNDIDVRDIIPSIRVPTLVLQSRDELVTPVAYGRELGQKIPNAKYVELESRDHIPLGDKQDAVLDEIEEFLTGVRDPLERNRVLATVLFTDIVESTQHALELGDRKWRELIENHHGIVRKNLARFRGKEVDTAGDGFFATFDGPARGIRCAQAITGDVKRLGIEVRAGLHTGECEIIGDKVGGIAVHTGARVLSKADASQVWVSSTVKDLVAGSGIQFEDEGMHVLKGIPGEWHLFRVMQ
jgi:pimeloyl-ACP methyl ester carboxylesterase